MRDGQEAIPSARRSRLLKGLLLITHHSSLITIFILSACTTHDSPHHLEFLSMGTTVSIDVVGGEDRVVLQAISAARTEIERIGKEWYAWQPQGELALLNAALARGEPMTVSPALVQVLQRAQHVFRLSDGYFDPAVAPLVELWGFQQADRDPKLPLPSETQLQSWGSNHATLGDLVIENTSVRSTRTDLKLDLGAIGKGFAVDIAIQRLRERGIANALVNAGGNLRAIGFADLNGEKRKWRIAIRSPRGADPLAWLDLSQDESLSTSGDYERFAVVSGQLIHHLLDPRTGRSATHTMAVTVVAADATSADAASTAIFVAGPEHWRAIARQLGIQEVLRISADGSIVVTRALAARLHGPSSEPRQASWREVDL